MTCSKKPHSIWPNGMKVIPLWSSKFLDNDLIITSQPQMRNGCSWIFWKGESKIFIFHVGQNSIWSLYDDVNLRRRPFHFGQFEITGPLLFLETFLLTSNSSMLMFEMSNETHLNMNGVFLTTSHLQIQQLTYGWLLQLIDDLAMHRWIWASTSWLNGSKIKP